MSPLAVAVASERIAQVSPSDFLSVIAGLASNGPGAPFQRKFAFTSTPSLFRGVGANLFGQLTADVRSLTGFARTADRRCLILLMVGQN